MKTNDDKLNGIVANARRSQEERERAYRKQVLKLYPWICGRCQREFTRAKLSQLSVHHRDHDHDNNPPDGSNWELLCVYCHDNEHQRFLESAGPTSGSSGAGNKSQATHNPFADLKKLLKD